MSMRLGSAVHVKKQTILIVAALSFCTFTLILVNRLDYVTLVDGTVQQTKSDMCVCGITDYASLEGRQRQAPLAVVPMATTRQIEVAEWRNGVGDPVGAVLDSRLVQPEVDQMPAILLLDHLTRSNMSLDDTRRTLDELKLAVRHMERRIRDDAESTDINNGRNLNDYGDDKSDAHNATTMRTSVIPGLDGPLIQPVESVLQPNGATSDEKRRSRATDEYFRRISSDPLRDDVVWLLRQAVTMAFGERRKPRPVNAIKSPKIHRSVRRPWKEFDNSITQHDLYRSSKTVGTDSIGSRGHYVDRLLQNMASLPVHRIEEMVDRGTQLKLILTLSDGTNVLFKPMRVSKDVESNPNHFVFNEMERHHAEIAAFHLDRLFDFRRVPPVAGRYVNLTSQIIPFASAHLARTFFISPECISLRQAETTAYRAPTTGPFINGCSYSHAMVTIGSGVPVVVLRGNHSVAAGNICFFGECKYYCDSHHAVCGTPDVIEGSAAIFLPSDDEQLGPYPRKTWPNPWAQVYSKRGKLPTWKTQEDFCDEVRSTPPYDSGRRLLDMMDLAVFDFLTGNLDRHHYYTFKPFGNNTYPILTDNGRGFGRSRKDDIELLAPIYQCCLIRASTLEKVVNFASAAVTGHYGNHMSLSQAISKSLKNDVIDGVLNNGHLVALDRRIKTVAIIVYDCLNRTLTAEGSVDKMRLDLKVVKRIVVDDGF